MAKSHYFNEIFCLHFQHYRHHRRWHQSNTSHSSWSSRRSHPPPPPPMHPYPDLLYHLISVMSMQPTPTQPSPPAWEEELHPRENYEVNISLLLVLKEWEMGRTFCSVLNFGLNP